MSHLQIRKRRHCVSTRTIALVSVMVSMGWGLPADAHDAPRKDPGQLSQEAELVFEGTVTKVDYALSDGSEAEDAKLPHTFVTYSVAGAHKGLAMEQNTITLRFLGGPTPDGRIFVVSNSPQFEVGQRDVLFVRGNGTSDCPLVDCNKGRFRVINNQMFTDDGVEVLQTPDGRITYGKRQRLPQVMNKKIGPATLGTKLVLPTQDAEEQGKMQYHAAEQQLTVPGQLLNIQNFNMRLSQEITARHRPDQFQALRPVPSVKLGAAFKALAITPAASPQLLAPAVIPPQPAQFDQMEVDALNRNSRNPVMREPRPQVGRPLLQVPMQPLRVIPRGVEPGSEKDVTAPEGGTPPSSEGATPATKE
jgi:hypothetical protein